MYTMRWSLLLVLFIVTESCTDLLYDYLHQNTPQQTSSPSPPPPLPNLLASQSSLAFATKNSRNRSVTITSSGSATITSLAVAASYASGSNWLQLVVNSLTNTITVKLANTALAAGSYNATVTVSASGHNNTAVTVSLSVDAPLFDAEPSLTANSAWGLRRLLTSYTGPAIQIQSTAPSAPLQDIFFNAAGDLDLDSWLNNLGSFNANVKNVYNQIASSPATVVITGSPKIAVAGALYTMNSQPAIRILAADKIITSGLIFYTSNVASITTVYSKSGVTTGRSITGDSGNWLIFHYGTVESSVYFNNNPGGHNTGIAYSPAGASWMAGIDTASVIVWKNGGQTKLYNSPNLASPGQLAWNGRGFFDEPPTSTSMCELIILKNKLNLTQVTNIYANQRVYWGLP